MEVFLISSSDILLRQSVIVHSIYDNCTINADYVTFDLCLDQHPML